VVSWLAEILWSLWAGLSTVGSVAFLLLAGLALFGLFVGVPHLIRQRRLRRRATTALQSVPQAVREQILAVSRELGNFPAPEAILAASPGLRASLSGLGIPPEELIDRLLASEAPVIEEAPADLQ
jgi:hypothetical protein